MRILKQGIHFFNDNFALLGLFSFLWLIVRTGTKPSRAFYPCQQAAALNANLWLLTYFAPILAVYDLGIKLRNDWKPLLVVILLFSVGYIYFEDGESVETNLKTTNIPP